MKVVEHKRLDKERKDIPEGQIFFVIDKTEKGTSPHVIIGDRKREKDVWAFMVKIKGEFYGSSWFEQVDDEMETANQLRKAYDQMRSIHEEGWTRTGERVIDEVGEEVDQLMCVYCHKTTTEPGVPCECRIVANIERESVNS